MSFGDWYYNNLGKLLIVTLIIFAAAFIVIGKTIHDTGDFVLKDVSLTGGVSARIEIPVEVDKVEAALEKSLGQDVLVKRLAEFGSDEQTGFTVEAGGDITADQLENALHTELGLELNDENFSVEQTGSSLGQSFYKQMVGAIAFAFLLMAIVVFITFRAVIPSIAVVAAALFDMVATIAVLDILGIKLSTAGIAALLLLIGYSIDTDVLLTTRVLRRDGETKEKIFSSIKTGMTMTFTAIAALLAGLLVSNSDVIREMFLIVIVGLAFDLISTWVTNVWLVRWYAERKKHA